MFVRALGLVALVACGCSTKPPVLVTPTPAIAKVEPAKARRPQPDWSNLQHVRDLKGPKGKILTLAFSRDGTLLAAGTEFNPIGERGLGPGEEKVLGGEIRVWDTDSGRIEATLSSPDCDIGALAFSPDGASLAGTGQGIGSVWSSKSWAVRFALPRSGYADGLEFSRDSRWIVHGGEPMTISANDGSPYSRPIDFNADMPTFSPDGSLISTGTHLIRFPSMAKVARTANLENSRVFSPDGRRLFGSTRDELISWAINPGGTIGQAEPTGVKVHPLWISISHDGSCLAAPLFSRPGSHGWQFGLFAIHSDKHPMMKLLQERSGSYVTFSPTSPLIAIATEDGRVEIWKAGSMASEREDRPGDH